jgi:cell wall-associated NlpC family hydrolase
LRAFALVTTICAGLIAAPAAMAQSSVPTDTTTGAVQFPGTVTPAPSAVPPVVTPPIVDPTAAAGGALYGQPNPAATQVVPGMQATLLPNGLAAAPVLAPQAVKDAISAANEIVGKPYQYGGGHTRTFRSKGYDCSGTISYALRGGSLLTSPLDSSSFMKWGTSGVGQWITIYTNPAHAFAVIAGLRLDTSAAGDPTGAKGPRWRPVLRKSTGFKIRHPDGL